jgi:hypothetical protein
VLQKLKHIITTQHSYTTENTRITSRQASVCTTSEPQIILTVYQDEQPNLFPQRALIIQPPTCEPSSNHPPPPKERRRRRRRKRRRRRRRTKIRGGGEEGEKKKKERKPLPWLPDP